MGLLNFVKNLYGRTANTVNNDIVKPARNAYNAVNPQHGLPITTAVAEGKPQYQIPYEQRHQYVGYMPGEEPGGPHSGELRAQPPLAARLIAAFGRDVAQPLIRKIEGKAAPVSPAQYTQHILDVASKKYGITPQFRNDITATNARFIDASNPLEQTLPGDSGVSSKGFAGIYNPDSRFKGAPSILIDKNSGNEDQLAQELVHEGLHSEWARMTPTQKNQFAQVLDNTLPPRNDGPMKNYGTPDNPIMGPTNFGPRQFLDYTIGSGYEFKPGQLSGFSNIVSLPEHAIDEAHSYLPAQYYDVGGDVAHTIPAALQQQYSPWLYASPQQVKAQFPQLFTGGW